MKFRAACKYCGTVGHMVKPAGDPAGGSATSVLIGYPRLFSTVAIPQLQFHACQQAVCIRFWVVIFINVNVVIHDIRHVIVAALVLMCVHDPPIYSTLAIC